MADIMQNRCPFHVFLEKKRKKSKGQVKDTNSVVIIVPHPRDMDMALVLYVTWNGWEGAGQRGDNKAMDSGRAIDLGKGEHKVSEMCNVRNQGGGAPQGIYVQHL